MNTPRVLGVIPDSPASRRFLEREIGSRPTPMGLGSAYRTCPSCGERSMAWVSGQCLRCHNAQRSLAAQWRDLATKAPPARQTPAPPPAGSRRPGASAAEQEQLRAWRLGLGFRAQYPGETATAIANALGFTVTFEQGSELDVSLDGSRLLGQCRRSTGAIRIASDRPFAARESTVGHEIAHLLHIGDSLEDFQMERCCDVFGAALAGLTP